MRLGGATGAPPVSRSRNHDRRCPLHSPVLSQRGVEGAAAHDQQFNHHPAGATWNTPPQFDVRGAASAPGPLQPRPVTLAASARSTSNAPPLRATNAQPRNQRQQNHERPRSRCVRARLRCSSRASLPLTPQAGTPTATIGMRPATPLRTKAKSDETTPSGCRTSWVLLRVQRCPRPYRPENALSRRSVREHFQVGRAARRWQVLVGVRWQRFQCRVAAFYFHRVTLPVQFWRACGCPVTLKPRPGAPHSQPEVRKARAPATQTKRARLPAFSTGHDGAEKLADWRLGGKSVWPLAEQANSSFLPPSSACSARSQNSATPAAPTNRDPASFDSLRSVCVMKDAADSQPQELLSIVPQRPHRRPLCRTPGAGGTKDNSVLWPDRLACLSRSLLCWSLRPNTSAVRAPVRPRILHATPLTPLL